MSNAALAKADSKNVKTTLLDLKVAKAFYPILIELATSGTTMQYKELIEKAKSIHPNDDDIQKMIPVRCGRVLGVIYRFAEFNNLPRISTLIIGKGGECGVGITEGHNAQYEREICYAHNWTNEIPKFWDYIKTEEASITSSNAKKIVMTMTRAHELAWDFYKSNKAMLNADIARFREDIAKQLADGCSLDDAFKPFVKN
jgi:hypothetical protein